MIRNSADATGAHARRGGRHGQRHREGDEAGWHRATARPPVAADGGHGLLWWGRVLLRRVGRATPSDGPGVERLLAASGLPLEGAAEALSLGVVARDGDEVVAAAAIERYGDAGLLRSVVVEPGRLGMGLGQDIVAAAEQLARDDGIKELYLLTETAIDWFPRLGYEVTARGEAVAAVGESIEFTTVCKDTGVPMRRTLA